MKTGSVLFVCLVVNQLHGWVGVTALYCTKPIPTVTSNVVKHGLTMNSKALILSSCQITSIDKSAFLRARKLTNLSLKNNSITDLNVKTFQHVRQLIILNLSANKIHTLRAGVFAKLVYVETVNLDANRISSIERGVFKDMVALQELSLGSNKISTLHADTFSNNGKLTYLKLSFNNIRNLETDLFKNLILLKTVNLSNNYIHNISRELFSNLTNLRELYLYENNVQELEDGCFSYNKKLEVLWLHSNNISHLDNKLFTNLTNLMYLSLANNSISHIAASTFPNPGIRGNNRKIPLSIALSDNPWMCGCRIKPLYNMWRNFTDFSKDPRCAAPPTFQNISWRQLSAEDLCPGPTNSIVDKSLSVNPGTEVSLTCMGDAESVEWFYNNNTIHKYSMSASGHRYSLYNKVVNETRKSFTLIINDARVEDAGRYTCYTNTAEQVTFELEVPTSHMWQYTPHVITICFSSVTLFIVAAMKRKWLYNTRRNEMEREMAMSTTPLTGPNV